MDTNLDENGMLLYINALGEEPGLAKGPIAVVQLSTTASSRAIFCNKSSMILD
jgi:hypothetical protein